MNPWQILNIESTDDKKVIKKAYAALIKQYKPDEHPEKFQEIQAAYKMVLSMQQWQEQQSDADSDQSKLQQTLKQGSHEVEKNFSLQQAEEVDGETLFDQHEQEQLVENLFKQLHQMTFSPLVVKSKLDNWKFIEDYYKIDDLTLKPQVAREVFKKVAEYNLFQLKENGTLLIEKRVIQYFNHIFDWSTQWSNYQTIFDEHYYVVNFQFIDTNSNEIKLSKQKSTIYLRLASLFIDALFVYGISFMFRLIQTTMSIPGLSHFDFPIIFQVTFITFMASLELLSKRKRTPGKSSNELIIVDDFGSICSTKQIIIRHLVLYAQVAAIYFIPQFFENSHEMLLVCFYSCLATNLILYAFSKKMLHDYLSKTRVIMQLISSKN